MDWRIFYRDVLPFCALITVQCTEVGVNILYKAATLNGLSYYVFIVYSYAISTLVLLFPLPFIFRRLTGLPSLNLSVVCRIFLLGLLGYCAVLCGYKGIEYSSPTLASAASNLGPAFTFILAVFFGMEKATLRSSSTQAKIIGTAVSISGALLVVLCKGPTILSAKSSTTSPSLDSSQRNWVLGGFLLAVAYFLMSIWCIAQTHIIKQYPAELIVVFLYNLCATIISAPVCLLVEGNLGAWKLMPHIALVAIIYSGLFSTGFSTLVQTWGLHLKGPVYVSIFKPLSIAIAAAMSFIFLGDALYLGSVVGAVTLSIGFYAVIWGKAKEEEFSEDEDYSLSSSGPLSNSKTPLLQNYRGEDM